MNESVSFKAYLKREGQEVEVRRFAIDSGAASNVMYLRSKIQAMFPSIQNDQFTVHWIDSDNDFITIGSDEELMEALTSGISQPFKLFLSLGNEQQGVHRKPEVHPNITCDFCESEVVGFRYKCVTCPNFDLCASCEGAGKHPEHFMLRMPFPLGNSCHPKFFRKVFGRPHKFHKFAKHHPQAGGRCPYSRRQGPTPGQPEPSSTETDMFNFSALMEFINSMTGATIGQANEPVANSQASATAQATPEQQAGSQQGPVPPRPRRNTGVDYLNGIGQAITAFLDPFGVDVTFDVRTPTSHTQETPTTSEPSNSTDNNTPTTSQQNTPTVAQQNVPAEALQKVPVTAQQNVPSTSQQNNPSTSQQNVSSPTLILRESSPPTETPSHETRPVIARRNSDDWTLISRESPTRSEVAMDVDESRITKSSAAEVINGAASPTAPPAPQPSTPPVDRQGMQEAISSIRSMGFNNETQLLIELLKRNNGDIASVLEAILNQNSTINN